MQRRLFPRGSRWKSRMPSSFWLWTASVALPVLICLNAAAQSISTPRLDSLKQTLPALLDTSARIQILRNIAEGYSSLAPDSGIRYAQQGLALALSSRSRAGEASAHHMLGNNFVAKGENSMALQHFFAALRLYEELGNRDKIIAVSSNIGTVYKAEENWPKATEYFTRALNDARATGSKLREGVALSNLGAVAMDEGNWAQALTHCTAALQLAQETNDRRIILTSAGNIALIRLHDKDYTSALKSFNTVLRAATETSNMRAYASTLGNIGETYLAVAVADSDAALHPAESAQTLSLAIRYLDSGIAQCRSQGFLRPVVKFSARLSEAQAMLGEYAAALHSYQTYSGLKDTLYNAEKRETIKNLEDAREIELRDKQLKISALELSAEKQSAAQAASLAAARAVQQAQELKLRQSALDLSTQQLTLTRQEKDLQSLAFEKEQGEARRARQAVEAKLKFAAQQSRIQELELRASRRARWVFVGGLAALSGVAAVVMRQSRLRKAANKKLALANAELDEANRVKARLFGVLSHDLRGPVANLTSFLHLQRAAPDALDAESKRAHEAKMETAANNLLQVMEDLLLWSKGQMTSFKPITAAVSVADVFSDVRKLVPVDVAAEIVFEDWQQVTLNTDENFLKAILRNLTGNALKAVVGQTSPRVVLRAWKENTAGCISVSDNGPGMTEEQRQRLFSESAVTSSKSGLGLHIVRDFARMLGMELSVKSAIGNGTEVALRQCGDAKKS